VQTDAARMYFLGGKFFVKRVSEFSCKILMIAALYECVQKLQKQLCREEFELFDVMVSVHRLASRFFGC